MKLKQYNWIVTVEYLNPKAKFKLPESRTFTIGNSDCSKKQALDIAKILFDDWKPEGIRLKNHINKPNEV